MRPDDAAAALMRRRRFPRHNDQVAATRRFVSQALPRGSELRETARLLVSETVTSILDQAPAGPGHGSFEVAWAVIEHRLRVEVSDDGGPARLRHRIHDRQSASGSGLQLAQTLADRWGSGRAWPGGRSGSNSTSPTTARQAGHADGGA
jgi:anti-sigma regulatory factor (Ser/Thr protein kinase)